MVTDQLRARLAVEGVRLAAPAPVARRGGAGPTDDGHLLVDGHATAIPIVAGSRLEMRDGRLLDGGTDVGIGLTPTPRPRFYGLRTSDGVDMHRLARLHGADVLASTVVQTCVRYTPDQRCRYCSIEESLAAGATTRVKTPQQLAEVAAAAVRLDGVRHMVLTTGTSAAADRGARHLARCAAAVKAAVPHLPIQVQCEPPDESGALAGLERAGADSIGIHVESFDDTVRARWLPGKAKVPLARYWDAWAEAVSLFGRNQVSTYLLLGLGEDPGELLVGVRRLIAMGVYPFIVPVRPGIATLAAADGLRSPSVAYVAEVSRAVHGLLAAAAMSAAEQKAGCAACGACSTVSDSTIVRLSPKAAGGTR